MRQFFTKGEGIDSDNGKHRKEEEQEEEDLPLDRTMGLGKPLP